MNRPEVGCGALIERDGKVLLLKRRKAPEAGHWSLVGGRVEFGESTQTALLREVAEEVGVDVTLGEMICLVEMLQHDNQHWVSPVYRAKIIAGEPNNREPTKIDAVQWFSPDDLPSPLAQAAREAIAKIFG